MKLKQQQQQQEREEAAAHTEAQRLAAAKTEARRAEEERLRREWQESQQSVDQPEMERYDETYMRRTNDRSSMPNTNVDIGSNQPVVKPPQSRGQQKNFPPKPAFTSPSINNNESTDERFLDEDTWREQQEANEDYELRGPSRFKNNIMKLRRDSDPSYSPPFGDREPPNVRPPPPPDGFMVLESEEALIEAFEDMATFERNSDYNPPRNIDPIRQQSNYDGSYFMDVPPTDDPGYPSPEVSSPRSYSNQDPYNDNNNWSNPNFRTTQNNNPEPTVRSPSSGGRGIPANGNDWSRDYDVKPPPPPSGRGNSRRSPMSSGSSYLDNLSKPNEDSMSSGRSNRGSSSYLNNLSSYNPQQSGGGGSSSSSGEYDNNGTTEFPERIQAAYVDWCQYYGKTYNEGRLRIFAANFLAVEKYHRETGVSLILNELADMTSDEFQRRKME
jgi:hypothetical protein